MLRRPDEKAIIQRIANNKKVEPSDQLDELINLGLVIKDGDNYKLFGKLFEDIAISTRAKTEQPAIDAFGDKLHLNDSTGVINLMGRSIEEELTNQEYRVMKFLLTDQNRLRSREDIGKVMWGEESYEKYSDWAIDQVMSKIRKKLKTLGTSTKLVTIRGRGYKLSNN